MRTVRGDTKKQLHAVNNLHPNLQFTLETTDDKNSLPFLDMSINVQPEGNIFCTWYQKQSHTGTILNYLSCAALQHKKSIIQGTIHRLFRATGNWEAFHEALTKNEEIWDRNQYPRHWVGNIVKDTINKHSKVSPQNVYKSFTNGLQHKLTFIARTTPNADSLLREAEKIIDKNLIPSMLNHPSYSDRYRKVFSLPLKEGGLNILLPEDRANEYERSIRVCEPLQNQNAIDAEFYQEKILQKIRKEKQEQAIAKKLAIKDLINDKEAYSLDLAMEKGASCWLNALPLKRYHFDLTKGEFRDGIALR